MGAVKLTPDYLQKYSNGKVFIETGTFKGETLDLVCETGMFDELYSMELNHELAEAAKNKEWKGNVTIFEGDSIDVLNDLLPVMTEKTCTFWLDAHASGPLPGGKSGGGPVLDELNIILKSGRNDHTIFIDDRRLFGSAEWGFVQEKDAMDILQKINPEYDIYWLSCITGPMDVICATVRKQ